MYRFFDVVKRYSLDNNTQDPGRHALFVAHWRKVLCTVFRVSQALCVGSLSADLSPALAASDPLDG